MAATKKIARSEAGNDEVAVTNARSKAGNMKWW
jgi:hypothetical protein